MPVVPTEQNKLDLASVSGAKFEAADLSGTGLQALGSGMQSLGETGQKVADDQHQVAIADDAAVKAAWNAYSDQARAIRANFYAQHGVAADAALQPSIEALHGARAALHAELTSRRQQDLFDRAVQGPLGYDVIGFNAYAARAKGVEQDSQSIIAQQGLAHDATHNADNPAFASKLLDTGSESIKTQAIVQGRDPASVDEQVAKYRSSVHLDVILGPKGHDPLAAHHYLAKNSGDMIEPHKLEAVRLLAPALGQLRGVADIDSYPMLRSATEPATPPGDIATVTGRILEVEAARRTGGNARGEQVTSAPGVADASTTGMLALMQLYRGSAPKSLAASLLGTDAVDALVAKHGKDWFGALPGEAYKAVAHDMGMLGAGTSPREAPAPEDRAAVAGWIDAQPWDDARKQSAHEELHTRAGLEDRRRTETRDKAREAAFATIDKLGAGFISVNQLPPAVRRDLGDDALAALTLRADRNVHPVTVAAHGDVAMDLNRMAASNPDAFAKEDLRLHRDEMSPAEYDALARVQKAWSGHPPGVSGVTQQRTLEKVRSSGLDIGPQRDAAWSPSASNGPRPLGVVNGAAGGEVERPMDNPARAGSQPRPSTIGDGSGDPRLPPQPVPAVYLRPGSGGSHMDSDGPLGAKQALLLPEDTGVATLPISAPAPAPVQSADLMAPSGTNLSTFDPGFGGLGRGVKGDYRTTEKQRAWLPKPNPAAGSGVRYPDGSPGTEKKSREKLRQIREEVAHLYTLPEVKALLDVFARTEETEGDGYFRSHYPDKKKLPDLKSFHGTVPIGRYQITLPNWKNYGEGWWSRPDFSPISQDIVAITLLRQKHVIDELMRGNLSGAFSKASRIFASIPMSSKQDYSAFVGGKYDPIYNPKTQGRRQPSPVRFNDLPALFVERLNARRQEFREAKQAWETSKKVPQAFISPMEWQSFGIDEFKPKPATAN